MSRRLEGIVVAGQRQRHSEYRQEPSPAGVIDSGDILRELFHFEECRNGNRLFGLLIDHYCHAYATIGMAPTRHLSPISIGTMDQIGPIGEGAHERDREPVARRLAESNLTLHVVRQV